jgi:lipopolysaccharide/colanic/teichoic acid biosynthesis glycosyltransferase
MLQTASPMSHPWRGLKRILDISFGLLAFVLALPVMAVAAALICMVDPGPVLYGQMRRGLHGQPLKIWKLRSMYQDSQPRLDRILQEDPAAAAEWATRFKLSKDPRILPVVGCFIRKFSLDELPQLWNVIRGDLSLVGPRVFVDYDLDVYSPEALRLRQSVMAGLTGLWQVSVRSDGDNRDKVRYDSAYVRNWSFWMDLDILYRTVGVVLTGRGAT